MAPRYPRWRAGARHLAAVTMRTAATDGMHVRVGIIGRGWGERVVAPAFAAADGCAVADVVSARDDAAVAALCKRDDVDLISVDSPPLLHRGHVGLPLEAGRAVLCDKPFGRHGADAMAMRTAA